MAGLDIGIRGTVEHDDTVPHAEVMEWWEDEELRWRDRVQASYMNTCYFAPKLELGLGGRKENSLWCKTERPDPGHLQEGQVHLRHGRRKLKSHSKQHLMAENQLAQGSGRNQKSCVCGQGC